MSLPQGGEMMPNAASVQLDGPLQIHVCKDDQALGDRLVLNHVCEDDPDNIDGDIHLLFSKSTYMVPDLCESIHKLGMIFFEQNMRSTWLSTWQKYLNKI